MADVAGKSYAITNTTPMPPWKTVFARIVFWVVGRLGIPRQVQQNLREPVVHPFRALGDHRLRPVPAPLG